MRKRNGFQPDFDQASTVLERRLALSAVVASTSTPLDLVGMVAGTARAASVRARTLSVSTLGPVSPLGFVKVTGTIANDGGDSGRLVLSNAQGSVEIVLSPASSGSQNRIQFTIGHGTGAYRHATGSGTAELKSVRPTVYPRSRVANGAFALALNEPLPIEAALNGPLPIEVAPVSTATPMVIAGGDGSRVIAVNVAPVSMATPVVTAGAPVSTATPTATTPAAWALRGNGRAAPILP
jgi:hypothetical protein